MDIRFQIEELQRRWTPPAGLHRGRPREVCLTTEGRVMLVSAITLLVLAVAVGVLLESAARRQAEDRRAWEAQAVGTQGRITRLWQRGQGEKTRYLIAYEFQAGGRSHNSEARIARSRWRSMAVGAVIPVRYLQSAPEVNYPFSAGPDTMPRFLPLVVALALGGLSWLIWYFVRRERYLLEEGRPALALITGHSKMHRSSHGGEVGKSAYYQFAQMSGALAKGETSPSKKPPEIGSTICVLYDPDNPGRNVRYPLSFVRPRQ